MIGQTISHYRIVAKLGEGGMGVVYKAEDLKLGRAVALKFPPIQELISEEQKARFAREAQAAAALNHPNICTLHEIDEAGGHPFIVMELVEGESVNDKVRARPLPLDEALDLAIQTAQGLQAAHEKGIVHRDIKSANLMVTRQGQVKVMDFGLAQVGDRRQLTKAGATLGTPAYMSPEQALAQPTDRRSDIWSLGVVLYEMLAGQLPFQGEVEAAIAYAIVQTEPEPPTARRTGLPVELDYIIEKALAKKPEQRYQHVADMLVDLRAVRKRLESGAPVPTLRPHRPPKLVWAAAAMVLAGAAAASLLWLRSGGEPAARSEWVQLTNFPDSAVQPALSPDGRMLTFIRGPSTFVTQGEVHVKILPDGNPVQLTRDNRPKMSPVFSPDGSRIAYTTGGWDTWVVPVPGGEPQLWLPNASGLVWADKGRVLFSEIKKGQHMAIVTAQESRAGARDVYLPARETGMAHRSYPSPDGNWALLVEMDPAPWLPCRLVPMDGSSPGRQVGPPEAGCTYAAWSPDGEWMYLNSSAGGAYHIWRQRFPGGEPQQITSGPTEEEGIAVAPDGRSLVTSVGLRQRSVWIHDENGDRQVSLEGYAYQPKFTPDGKKLLYRISKGGDPSTDPTELWVADLASGSNEPLLPGLTVIGNHLAYDVSPDGAQVVVASRDAEGKPRLWLASLDRRFPPRQIPNVEGESPVFAPDGEIFFAAGGFVHRVLGDGTGLRKAVEQSVTYFGGLSPDGRWLMVTTIRANVHENLWFAELLPLDGGPAIRVSSGSGGGRLKWSADGTLLFYSVGRPTERGASGVPGRTFLIPLPPGRMLNVPEGGFRAVEEIAKLPGVRVIESADAVPGPAPEVYAFSRESVQRNLYRIPLP